MSIGEIIEWSHAIADACKKTTIKPADVRAACEAFVRARSGRMTNHQLYYGSPERVVEYSERTEACASSEDGRIEAEDCDVCKLALICNCEPSLEWLREEAS